MGRNEHKMKEKDLLRNRNSNAIKWLVDINSSLQKTCKKGSLNFTSRTVFIHQLCHLAKLLNVF